MPTYVYACERGHEFEREQRITDEPITHCRVTPPPTRACCSAPCRRLISRTSFVLNGKCWGKDGYTK